MSQTNYPFLFLTESEYGLEISTSLHVKARSLFYSCISVPAQNYLNHYSGYKQVITLSHFSFHSCQSIPFPSHTTQATAPTPTPTDPANPNLHIFALDPPPE